MADGNGEQQVPTAAEPQPADAMESAGGATAPEGATADPQAQLEAARAEAVRYKDKYLREYAERENVRKRQERVLADRIRYERREMLSKVLDLADNLDRAAAHQESMDREQLLQTLRMLQWQVGEVLRSEGLSPVPTVGQPFDPRIHEAIETVVTDEQPEGTVVEEVRKGYKQGDDMLRPARVKVSAGAERTA